MKTFLLAIIVLLTQAAALFAEFEADLSVMALGPAGPVPQTKKYPVQATVCNYGPFAVDKFKIHWTVTKAGNVNAKLDKTRNVILDDEPKPIIKELKPYQVYTLVLDSVELAQDQEYLVIAEIEHYPQTDPLFRFVDLNPANNWFDQHVGSKYCDAGVFVIDQPSPKDHKAKDLYITIVNNGPAPMENCYTRWLWQDKNQGQLYDPVNDTTAAQMLAKNNLWRYQYHVFNPPIDSGQMRQILVSELPTSGRNNVLLVGSCHPNGISDLNLLNDTARLWLSSTMWGNYSVGDIKNIKSSFKSINEAIGYLYDHGMEPYSVDSPAWGLAGVQFFVRPGTYNGSVNLDGNFANQSIHNIFSMTAFDGNKYKYIIQSDDGTPYCLRLNNIQHFAINGFNLILQSEGSVVLSGDNVNNFIVGNCLLHSPVLNSTLPEHAVVRNTGSMDSCNFSMTTFINGSYGAYLTGAEGRHMNTVAVTDDIFENQYNCAISVRYDDNAIIARNHITNNRIELLDCAYPFAGDNHVYLDTESANICGRGYQPSEPFSLIGLFNCTDTARLVHNNLCVKSATYSGLHIKDCPNTTGAPSKIISCSIQSNTYGLLVENSSNIQVANSSLDLTSGQSTSSAAIYLNPGCGSIQFIRSIFNSTGGGYGVMASRKGQMAGNIMNNFFSLEKGHVFARGNDQGDFSDPEKWREYMNLQAFPKSTYEDPGFIAGCDLIACNPDVAIGYDVCKKAVTPRGVTPLESDNDIFDNVKLTWTEADTAHLYQLQVSKLSNFPEIYQGGGDNALSGNGDLVLDRILINESAFVMYNLEDFTDYYWRVRVAGGVQRSDWSEVNHFRTSRDPDGIVETGLMTEYAVLSRDYINSVSDRVYLFQPENSIDTEIEIYDYTGSKSGVKMTIPGSSRSAELTDMFAGLGNGLYLVKVRTGSSIRAARMLVAR